MSIRNDLLERQFKDGLPSETEADTIKGIVYVCADSAELAPTEIESIVLTTGDKAASLLKLDVFARIPEGTLYIYRNPIFTGGTPSQCMNLNDNIIADPDKNLSPISNPVVTDNGDAVYARNFIGQDNGGNVGDVLDAEIKDLYILRPNTSYLVQFENTSTATSKVSLQIKYRDREEL